MGCDIHAYWEEYNERAACWEEVAGTDLYTSRDYHLFCLMAGVRNYNTGVPVLFQPRGVPDDISLEVFVKYTVAFEEYYTKYGGREWLLGRYRRLENPDWHSASWLTVEEVRTVLVAHKKAWGDSLERRIAETRELHEDLMGLAKTPEGRAHVEEVIALERVYKEPEALARFVKDAVPTDRLVFWFDN